MDKKIWLSLIVLVIVAGGAYYLFRDQNNTSSESLPASSLSGVVLNIKDFAFDPPSVELKVGSIVTWKNNDLVPHRILSDSGNLLDSPVLNPGEDFTFTFNDPGTFDYHCSIHPTMKGKIVITK